MKKIINLLVVFIFISQNCFLVYAESNKAKSKQRQYNKIEKKQPKVPDVSFGADEPQKEELIQVSVRNDFDEEIKVKFDTSREYPIGPHELISLGQRKSGKYTLTIYNKSGEFIDNLTQNIDNKNKFVLNKDTVSNSDKITGLSTGQKVAIGAGALGAAALGGVLINKALQENNQVLQNPLFPPSTQQEETAQVPQLPPVTPPTIVPEQAAVQNNAFVAGGMSIKFLNTKYPQVTVIAEGVDGQPIGNNWVIPLALPEQKPQPLVLNSEKITINPQQKIKVILPEGYELQRYGVELETDPVDGAYVWVLK